MKIIQVAGKSDTMKLWELAQVYGQKTVCLWIEAWLVNLSEYMDFEVSEHQTTSTSIMILEELYMLKIPEFTLFFKKLRKGNYGQFYGKFNGQIIMLAALEFRKQRGTILSKEPTEEQDKYC